MTLFTEPGGEKTSSTRVMGFVALLFYMVISLVAVWNDPATIGDISTAWAVIIIGLAGAGAVSKFKPTDKPFDDDGLR